MLQVKNIFFKTCLILYFPCLLALVIREIFRARRQSKLKINL